LPDPALDEQSVFLPPDGLLLMYTDGVTEAMDGDRNQFGVEGLRALLHPGGPLRVSAQGVCEAVREAVRAHTGSSALQDDVTLVAVRVL